VMKKDEEKIYSCVEVRLGYRVNPGVVGERGHYSAKGKVIVKFIPYVMTGKDLADLKEMQDKEVLEFIDILTKETLDAMKKEIDEYTAEKKEEKKPEEKLEIPVLKQLKKINETINRNIKKFKMVFKALGIKMPPKKQDWEAMLLKAAAAKKAAKDAFTVYSVYKASHGMLAW